MQHISETTVKNHKNSLYCRKSITKFLFGTKKAQDQELFNLGIENKAFKTLIHKKGKLPKITFS